MQVFFANVHELHKYKLRRNPRGASQSPVFSQLAAFTTLCDSAVCRRAALPSEIPAGKRSSQGRKITKSACTHNNTE